MVSYIRARKGAQKEERKQAILDVARAMCATAPFAEVTMAAVADRAGLAKGTLYLYFKTKEELVLALLEDQLWSWFDLVDKRLVYLIRPSAGKVAALICETLAERPLLRRLLSILHALLEQNLDYESALRFKSTALERLVKTGARLEAALPFLPRGGGGQLLLTLHALVVGLQQMADPSPQVARVLADPRMAPLRVDFDAALSYSLAALLHGLNRTRSRRKS